MRGLLRSPIARAPFVVAPVLGAVVVALAVAAGPALAQEKDGAKGIVDKTADHDASRANAALVIAPNPSVVQGVLPNGLRYALKHNESPRGGVSIRLSVAAGAYDAEEDEVGVAHFVEHMAFAGAGPVEETAYANAFQGYGVDHGRDRNAHTALRETSYELDLPQTSAPALALSLRWLRQVADGATFPAPVVETEKGVLLNESRERQVAAYTAWHALAVFEEMGARSARRGGADPAESIQTTTPARLKAFYSKWYRPDNAVVVMVGDMPIDEMRQRIAAAFGSWKPAMTGPVPAHAAFEAIDQKAPPAEDIIAEPNGVPTLAICSNRQGQDAHLDTEPKLRAQVASDAWAQILNLRMQRLAHQADPPLASAAWAEDDNDKEARGACVTIIPRDGDWRRAMTAAQTELRRFAAYGPSAQELKDALHDLQNLYWNIHKGEEVGDSPTIAAALADSLSQGAPIPGNDADKVFDRATAGLTVDEVRAAFGEDWSGTGARIALVTAAPPAAGALKAAWAAGEAAPPPAAGTAVAAVSWPYDNFGKPGKVVARQAFPILNMVRLTFANGVTAYVKTQNTEAERRVTVEVAFGAGRHALTADKTFVAALGGRLTPFLGLRRIGYDDMKRALQDVSWNVDFDIGDTQDTLVGSTWPSNLKTELQVLAAFASEPGFRSDLDAGLAPALGAGMQLMRSSPSAAIQLALGDALRPGQPSLIPDAARVSAMRAADFGALLRQDLTTDPLEVVVVGSIDEKTATPLLAATFGALPPRAPVDRTRADAWFMRGLDKPLPPITVTLPGAKTAAVGAVWPLWQADPAHRREEMAMQMAGRILADVLRKRVREQLGKTYSPAVEVSLPDQGDQGMAFALVDTAPGDLDQVRGEITTVAAGVAAGQFDQDALDRARAPFLAQTDQARTLNLWWASLIAVTHGDPAKIDETVAERDIVASLTLDEVKAAAQRWFSAPPTLITAVPERPGAQASAKP